MNDRIKMILIEPHKEPKVIEAPNRLEVFKSLVGGYIEGVCLSPTAYIYVNEEGKLQGLEPNRRFNGDILVGNIVIVGVNGPDTVSLTPEQIKKYTEQFKQPENISREELNSVKWEYFFF